MTAEASLDHPGRPALEGPEPGSLEARASLALKIISFTYVAGILLAQIPGSVPMSTLLTVAFNAAAAVIAITFLAVARGLDKGQPWAEAAVRPVLVILAAVGAHAFAVGLPEARIRIPFEVALAAWAFMARRDGAMSPRTDRRTIAALALAFAMAVQMGFASIVFGWGGVLDVRREDLVASLVVDCGPEVGGAPPQRVTISYDWSWARTAPLPNEIDMVVVGWSGDDDQERPLYTVKDIPDAGRGIRPGLRGVLSAEEADAVQQRARGSYRWGVELDNRGYQPGRITLELALAPRDVRPGARTQTFIASYVHLNVWRQDAQTVTCLWSGGALAPASAARPAR